MPLRADIGALRRKAMAAKATQGEVDAMNERLKGVAVLVLDDDVGLVAEFDADPDEPVSMASQEAG
jgi:hypothetical protein|tara:strand:- start:10929 stop:11126 length:198 start_codon:yes stop_codon:yes gene_type:complete